MIYHVITGDENKRLSTKYAKEINNSITKMMFTRIIIKTGEEAVMYDGLKNFIYDSYILPAERITAILNGTEVACIHIPKSLPLYTYANYKKQRCRIYIPNQDTSRMRNEKHRRT